MDGESTTKRKMVPRWRELWRTSSRELESHVKIIPSKEKELSLINRFQFLYEVWQKAPSLENAAEVVDAAVLIKEKHLAVGPAKQLQRSCDKKPAIQEVVSHVLGKPRFILHPTQNSLEPSEVQRAQISNLKKLTVSEPRNALAWVEMCRLHAALGNISAGERAANFAISSAPENRFVLRSICRFFVHIRDIERAHDVVRRSALLDSDPWIQAAEITMAEMRGWSPTSIKLARQSLTGAKFSEFHLSELAAAVGTLEASSGKQKLANKHFSLSLVDPTDNSLSQAYWMMDQDRISLAVDERKLRMKGGAEARLYWSEIRGNWESAISASHEWIGDEPFSLRAAVLGSFIATGILADHLEAINFCNQGLVANPRNLILINNKVVALCRSGNVIEAQKLLPRLRECTVNDEDYITVSATLGLAAFRDGSIEEGRQCYSRAAEIARKNKVPDVAFRVLFHWVYEEVFSGQLKSDDTNKLVEMLDRAAEKIKLNRVTEKSWKVSRAQMLNHLALASPLNTQSNAKLFKFFE